LQSEEDKKLKETLELLVSRVHEKVTTPDQAVLQQQALEALKKVRLGLLIGWDLTALCACVRARRRFARRRPR
jgi:hypothetical protein